jgi:N-acetylneuraminic acid mutarotase
MRAKPTWFVLLITFSIGSVLGVGPAQAASWTTGARLPAARVSLAAASDADGNVYAIGGFNTVTSTWVDTVYRYDPGANAWTKVAPLPQALASAVAVRGLDGRIYVFGGNTPTETLDSVEAYDPDTNTWSSLAPMPTPRYGAAATLGRDGMIYVIGGCCGNGPEYDVNEAYDPATNTWTTRAPTPAVGIAFAPAVTVGHRIFVLGGAITGDSLSIIQIYNPDRNRWRLDFSFVMPSARQSHGAATDGNGHVYVFGGFDGDDVFQSSVDVLTVKDKTWTSGPDMPAARARFGTASFKGKINVLGGYSCFTCTEGRNNYILSTP